MVLESHYPIFQNAQNKLLPLSATESKTIRQYRKAWLPNGKTIPVSDVLHHLLSYLIVIVIVFLRKHLHHHSFSWQQHTLVFNFGAQVFLCWYHEEWQATWVGLLSTPEMRIWKRLALDSECHNACSVSKQKL